MNRKRIDTVLRVRTLQEQLARQEVVRERQVLAGRIDAENAARAEVDDRADSRGTTTGALLADRRHMLRSGVSHADRLADRVLSAEQDVQHAMGSWRQVAQRLDGIERLSERLTDQERLDATRAESALIDDLVIARWNRSEVQ